MTVIRIDVTAGKHTSRRDGGQLLDKFRRQCLIIHSAQSPVNEISEFVKIGSTNFSNHDTPL